MSWIYLKDRKPNVEESQESLLVAFIGSDDQVFQRTLEFDYMYNEWSDRNGQTYDSDTIVAWQELPCVENLEY